MSCPCLGRASSAGGVCVASSFASMADTGDEGSVCGRPVQRFAGSHACELASWQPRRAKARMWNVRIVPPSPQRMRGFTRGRFHNLQRMMRVAVWKSSASVDDRLEQLVGLFNTGHGLYAGARPVLQCQRLRMPVPAHFICKAVHSDSDKLTGLLYRSLRGRLIWSDKAEVTDDTIAIFVLHLKGTFLAAWTLQCLAVYMLLMQVISHSRQLLVRGVVLLPCLASLTPAMICCILPAHHSCHVARHPHHPDVFPTAGSAIARTRAGGGATAAAAAAAAAGATGGVGAS